MDYQPVRLALPGRDRIPEKRVLIDGVAVSAFSGDTVLAVLLRERGFVRRAEFGVDPRERTGFCLMGACQDCWVSLADGTRLRACTTLVENEMNIITSLSHGRV